MSIFKTKTNFLEEKGFKTGGKRMTITMVILFTWREKAGYLKAAFFD